MNTSAIVSPANLLQLNTPTPAKSDLGAPDGPSFNQVLSREMNNEPAATPTQNTPVAATNKDAPNAVQQDGGGKNQSTQNDKDSDSKDAASADASNKVDEDSKVVSGKDVKKDEDDSDKLDPTDQAAIAAFVAALTSAKAEPADNAKTLATQPVATTIDGKSELKAKNDRIDIATKIANPEAAVASEQDAVGKKSDFVSALDKAQGDASGSAKDGAAKGIDLSAVPQAVKTPDASTIGATPQTFAAAMVAAVAQPSTAQAGASNELLPTVGSAGWGDAIGQKVVWMAKGMEQTATLTLNPPDLGPMQVTVNVNNNQATANFVAHQPEVRHALEASMPRLREMLNEAGIQLGQSSVSAGTPNQGGFDEARQGGGGSGRRAASSDAVDSSVQVTHVPTPRGGSGMVDTFA